MLFVICYLGKYPFWGSTLMIVRLFISLTERFISVVICSVDNQISMKYIIVIVMLTVLSVTR